LLAASIRRGAWPWLSNKRMAQKIGVIPRRLTKIYFSAVEMLVKVILSDVPRVLTCPP
jgi:hypothetical protein